jgi:hypothetical protein
MIIRVRHNLAGSINAAAVMTDKRSVFWIRCVFAFITTFHKSLPVIR